MNPYSRFKRVVAIDLETHLIVDGLLTPPIVCGAVAEWRVGEDAREIQGRLLYPDQVVEWVREVLLDDDTLITNSNVAFDFGCLVVRAPDLLRAIFRAYARGRVADCLVIQALHAIARGHLNKEPNGMPMRSSRGTQTERYSQDIVVRQVLGRTDAKDNAFYRLRYAILESLPHEEWPEEARQYPIDDVVFELQVILRQLGLDGVGPPHENLQDAPAQCESDWALHLGAIWGLRSDESRVALLEARAEELHREYVERFSKLGFFKAPRERYVDRGALDPDAGKRDSCAVAKAVAKAYGATGVCEACRGSQHRPVACRGVKEKGRYKKCQGALCVVCRGEGLLYVNEGTICQECDGSGFADLRLVPRTKKEGLSTSRDTLAESGDEDLADFGENQHGKVLGTYLPWLKLGIHHAITLEPNAVLESGRVSYSGPIQLFPRTAMGVTSDGVWVPTARECVVARPGRVFGSNDYAAGELCGLGQLCLWLFGYSRMAEVINQTKEPGALHTAFAAKMAGESVDVMKARVKAGDKVAKGLRTAGKSTNFALGGGMGSRTFVLTNRKESAGHTDAPDGRRYQGLRFCVLVRGERSCGVVKVREWGRPGYERETPPTCRACLETVEFDLRPLWFDMWPEVKEYHTWVKRVLDACNNTVPCFSPEFAPYLRWCWPPPLEKAHRVRDVSGARSPFSAGANSGFQGIIADVAKDALRQATREAYTDADSVLFKANVRYPGFMHDELLSEIDEDLAPEADQRISEIMMEAYRRWIPDVYGEAGPTLMRAWSKESEEVRDERGRLMVWTPELKKGKK